MKPPAGRGEEETPNSKLALTGVRENPSPVNWDLSRSYMVDLRVKVEQKVSALRTAFSDSTVILLALQLLPAL